ncbi:MAG: ASCH domain-containing protein [Candidatus Paceibacterota bacterium]
MKTLKFMPNLVPLVISGEKTSTWRLFDDKDLQKDDNLLLIDKITGKEFAKAIIVKIEEKKLKDLEGNDFNGHGKFESEEKMYETYKFYYGDKVNSDTIIKMVDFKLL